MIAENPLGYTRQIHLPIAGDIALPGTTSEGKINALKRAVTSLSQPQKYPPKPITEERIKELTNNKPFLARYVGKYGISVINSNPEIVKSHLSTEHNVKHGKPTDQKSSGRCWIFGFLNMMRIKVLEEYGEGFAYSQNYAAFWDKYERANHFLEKMIEMAGEEATSQRVMNAVEQFYADGGEWELFLNIVEKYGVVPDYAMPETEFAGSSGGYMRLLQTRLRKVGGVLHKMASGGVPRKELDRIKNQGLNEVYSVLTLYLGTPPKKFEWKESDSKVVQLTPLEFYKKNPCDLNSMVHVTHLPYRTNNCIIQVKDVGNVVGGVPMRGLNISIKVILNAIVKAIKSGVPIPCAVEMKQLDRTKDVLSMEGDQTDDIFGFDSSIDLSKADRLKYQVTKVAHLMNIVGCDDLDVVKVKGDFEGKIPDTLGPLLKVENSWKNHEEIFMTLPWIIEYFYGAVIPIEFLPEKYQKLWKAPAPPVEYVDAWDPFGRI